MKDRENCSIQSQTHRRSSRISSDFPTSRPRDLLCGSLLAASLLSLSVFVGCGGGSTATPAPPDYSLDAAPSSLTVVRSGSTQTLTVGVVPINSFTGAVSVTLSGLPSGVTATPSSLSVSPGSLGQFVLTASGSAVPATSTLTVSGVSGTSTKTASVSLVIAAPAASGTTATISSSFYDFGNNLVGNKVTQTVVSVSNTGQEPLMLSPAISGDPSYSVVSAQSCGTQLAASSSCSVVVAYTPATASAPNAQSAVLNLNFANVPSGTADTVALTGVSGAIAAGTVSATNNIQAALYTMTLPFAGTMTVNFGPTTSYGFSTWSKSIDAPGPVSVFVAGMKQNTTYHMAATVQLGNGITMTDTDHTFTVGTLPIGIPTNITVTTTPGLTPQPGVEVLNTFSDPTNITVTDLAGNIIWNYVSPGNAKYSFIQGVKLMANGDFLFDSGANSGTSLNGGINPNALQEIREINLGGDTVKEISITDLNFLLSTATCNECNVQLLGFHHDVTPLPNGHWLVLGNTSMSLSSSTTPSLTGASTPVNVLGDVIIDLDQNMRPVWAWNEFNHLDVNRQPYSFPDWTHTNAVVYSPDDGNILVSMRHQNWIVKVAYQDGAGDGHIIWHLGKDGDFTLKGGTDPTDWSYAQHDPGFFTPNTSGVFSLGVMDNGDDRVLPNGVTCGVGNAPPCFYTTVPVYQIDESGKTATLTFHQIVPTALYNAWGGNTEELVNGDVEYDLCGTATGSEIFEVTQTASPKTVWNLTVPNQFLYRGFRLPSLYPGVQW